MLAFVRIYQWANTKWVIGLNWSVHLTSVLQVSLSSVQVWKEMKKVACRWNLAYFTWGLLILWNSFAIFMLQAKIIALFHE